MKIDMIRKEDLSMIDPIKYGIEGGVCTVTLNRQAKNNAFNHSMLNDLVSALRQANDDDACKVILLNASGENFSVGDDLIDATDQMPDVTQLRGFMDSLQDVSRNLMFNRKPVVGAFQGWVVGGAVSWALNCDFPVWASSARAYLPETKYGIFASGGLSFLLPHRAGHLLAMEMFFSGEKYSADVMRENGLALRVVADEDLQDEALKLATKLAGYSAASLGDYKESIVNTYRDRLEKAIQNECFHCIIASQNPAVKEKLHNFAKNLSGMPKKDI
jgi:enoyl-CoA hydratase/carnithine racemase